MITQPLFLTLEDPGITPGADSGTLLDDPASAGEFPLEFPDIVMDGDEDEDEDEFFDDDDYEDEDLDDEDEILEDDDEAVEEGEELDDEEDEDDDF